MNAVAPGSLTLPAWFSSVPPMQQELHFDNRNLRCFNERPRSVYELLRDAVAKRPDGDGVVDGSLRLSWCDVKLRADDLARGLVRRGVQSGDRVGLLMGNRAEFVITVFALARLGAVCVPVGTRSQPDEIAYALEDSSACAVIADEDMVSRMPAAHEVPRLRLRISLSPHPDWSTCDDLLAAAKLDAPAPEFAGNEEETAFILYTSGTTGRPKGAMLTHLNVVHSALHYETCMGLGPLDRSIVAVPMSHVTGLVAQLLAIVRCAATLLVMPVFKVEKFLELGQLERITHTLMVPAMYNLCVARGDFGAWDLTSWRIGAFGGAPMPPATIDTLGNSLPDLVLMNAYGATETASPVSMMPPGQTNAHADSVGQPVPCADILVVDLQGEPVPAGQSGEIWIRGPMVVKGYWNNPQATAVSITEGYWHSGDIGRFDTAGFLYVLDRLKDVINRGGYKVYSSEVEAVLAAHPLVIEAATVGRPCPMLGERVHAFVVVREGLDAQTLKNFCATRLSDYKVPETFTFSDIPLARNPNGKLLKKPLRETARKIFSDDR